MQVVLPKLKVHLRTAGNQAIDTTSIESFEPIAQPAFWDKLLGNLRDAAETSSPPVPRRGGMMILVALALASFVVWRAFSDRQQVVEGFRDWLWR